MTHPQHHALPAAAPDEFLPPPGAWAHQLGWRTAAAGVALLALACVWPFDELAQANGQVRPQGENSPVQSLGGGRLSRVLVSPHQRVKAGQLLAEFDREPLLSQRRQLTRERAQLQEQLHQAERQRVDLQTQAESIGRLINVQIASARGGVSQALADSRFQDRELQRLRSLVAEGAIPQLLLEEKEAGAAVASSRLEQARLGVGEQRARLEAEQAGLRQSLSAARSAQAELERQLAAIDGRLRDNARASQEMRLLAPVDGTVVETKLRYPGQVLQPGDVVATLAPASQPLAVRVQLPARDVAPLRTGQTATLRVSSCPYTDFGVLDGRIQSIAADAVDGRYAVTITPGADQLRQGQRRCALRAGMDVEADLLIRRGTVMGFLLRKLRLLSST
jgi:multidrug efflux pump subunit AcrA (membrane-fusion protein)